MRYIRTENRIYEVSEKVTYCGKNFYNTTAKVSLEDIDIVKQAETLEGLCDEFVYYNPKTQIEKYRYEYYHNLSEKEYDLKELKKGVIIYGAIWCEWGLKYVAKLNEKGDLDLI